MSRAELTQRITKRAASEGQWAACASYSPQHEGSWNSDQKSDGRAVRVSLFRSVYIEICSRPTSSPVGSYLKQKPRTKEEIIKTQIGGSRFRTRKVYYISFFTYSLHRTRCYLVKNRLFTLYMELALKSLTNKSAHYHICKGELPRVRRKCLPCLPCERKVA